MVLYTKEKYKPQPTVRSFHQREGTNAAETDNWVRPVSLGVPEQHGKGSTEFLGQALGYKGVKSLSLAMGNWMEVWVKGGWERGTCETE